MINSLVKAQTAMGITTKCITLNPKVCKRFKSICFAIHVGRFKEKMNLGNDSEVFSGMIEATFILGTRQGRGLSLVVHKGSFIMSSLVFELRHKLVLRTYETSEAIAKHIYFL